MVSFNLFLISAVAIVIFVLGITLVCKVAFGNKNNGRVISENQIPTGIAFFKME